MLVNDTAISPDTTGFIQLTDRISSDRLTSSLKFTVPGSAVANAAVVAVGQPAGPYLAWPYDQAAAAAAARNADVTVDICGLPHHLKVSHTAEGGSCGSPVEVAFVAYHRQMALEIICPQCESDAHLSGTPCDDGRISLTCERCNVTWERDPRPKCPTCGGDDLYHKPQVILEKSRGTQMSVQGIHVEYGCWECEPPEVKVRGGRTHHLPDRLGGSQ